VPLDGANTQVVLLFLAPLVSAGRPCRLTLVLGNVVYVSCLALCVLAQLHGQLRAAGGRLTLRDAPDPVCEAVEAMRLTPAIAVRRRKQASPSATPHELSAPSPGEAAGPA
jgi:anti-anti-sigma regulatory factor